MSDATLGELLSAAGERIAARHLPHLAWADGLAPVLRRAAELSESWAARFDRYEEGSSPARPSDISGGRPLPVDVRSRLRAVAGPGADHLRVRTGPAADAAARHEHADAITVDDEVLVRGGRYQPDTPSGFALLAHEAAHVTAALRRGSHPSPDALVAEERQAQRVESAALSQGRQSFMPTFPFPATPAAVTPLASAPPATPPAGSPPLTVPVASAPVAASSPAMRADVDRTVTSAPAATPGLDVPALRRDLIDELMRRVRADFERGA